MGSAMQRHGPQAGSARRASRFWPAAPRLPMRASRELRSQPSRPRRSTGPRSAPPGKYEKLAGRFFGEVDPADPLNAADCRHQARAAKRARHGRVFRRPSHHPPDRHEPKGIIACCSRSTTGAISCRSACSTTRRRTATIPSTAADAGNGFMMRQGYTLVWGAWDAISGTRPDIGGGPFLLDAPVAQEPGWLRHRRAEP